MAMKIKLGDMLAIPLHDGRFVFGRVLNDASIGIYRYIAGSKDEPPPTETDYLFVVGVYRDVLTSGQWPRIAHIPFETEEESWQPPCVVCDPITGKRSIYHKGVIRSASVAECKDLEPAAVWDKEHIIDRIGQSGL
jgi:Immunity protein 26